MKPRPGLQSLASVARPGSQAQAQVEGRLRRAWLLVVGPTLVNQTCLVRAHRGVLVLGCWHPELIPSLRASAQAIWPQLRERLERLWKLRFHRLEIVPCDPPEARPSSSPARQEEDLLKAVLRRFREQAKGGWTPGRP
jgi:hypothetical protein